MIRGTFAKLLVSTYLLGLLHAEADLHNPHLAACNTKGVERAVTGCCAVRCEKCCEVTWVL